MRGKRASWNPALANLGLRLVSDFILARIAAESFWRLAFMYRP